MELRKEKREKQVFAAESAENAEKKSDFALEAVEEPKAE